MLPLTERIRNELEKLESLGRLRSLVEARQNRGTRLEYGGRELLNLSSNDYLGIGSRHDLAGEFLTRAARQPGSHAMTSSSSRLLTGNSPAYSLLEESLATLYRRQAALVFNSGYHANTGILPALTTRHDLILSDKLNHASIIDGSRIADATFKRYRHLDYAHLESLLQSSRGRYEQVFIVTESVFSMDGDLADLKTLCALKKQYGAVLIVDEAHGVGTFGSEGQGLCEDCGTMAAIDIVIGTFGKAFASAGAYAVMDELVRDYLVNRMRTVIFTTALPPLNLSWSLFVLEKQRSMQRQRQHLQQLAARLRDALASAGIRTDGASQIIPAILGPDAVAVEKATLLRDHGILALPVRPPTVPENTARLRFSLRADLSWEELSVVPQLLSR